MYEINQRLHLWAKELDIALVIIFNLKLYSPIEIQMRKNELQEQISDLKKKRLTLTELNKELESQLVEVCRFNVSVTVSH